jgi:hypothetical protein
MRPPQVLAVGLTSLLALAGIVAGCGGSDDAAGTGSTTSVDTTDALTSGASSESTVAAPVETEPPATEPTTPDPTTTVPAPTTTEAPDEGECLVGNWVVTEQQMDAFYAGLMSTLEAPLTIDTVGSAPLSFAADGTYTWAPGFALTVEVAGATGTGDVSGTINGKWADVDGVVTTFSDLNALVVSIEVNGVTFDGADLANGLLNSSPVNGVTYSCAGPAPVLDFKTADPSVTVPVTLTPA